VAIAAAIPAQVTLPNNLDARIAKARKGVQGLGIVRESWVPTMVPFFEHNEQYEFQANDRFWVGWTPNVDRNEISFTLAVQTTGWIGWGISQTGGMIGANPSIIREDPVGSGRYTCFATHSEVFGTPINNAVQNCDLVSYSKVANETLLTFTRPFYGCKPEDSDFDEGVTMRMVAAWGSSQTFYQHGIADRFTAEINAVTGPIEIPDLPADAFLINITLPPHNLPEYRDVYYCNGHVFPQDRRYHIIRSDALMYNIYPASYHHFLMFGCPGGLPREYEDPDFMVDCPVIPHPSCIKFFNGWALGQQTVYLEHGMPIGAGEGAAKEFLFQSHIDNPTLEAIREPGWGCMLTVTPTLTDIESGAFGMYSGVPLGGMPYGIEHFEVRSECASRMMQSIFPKPIYITSVMPHMHELGTSAGMQILRGRRWPRDSEWEEPYRAFSQTHWDANWQGIRAYLNGGIEVLPGDRLRVKCSYNTMNRTRNINNGEGFEDEMCIHYMIYYPLDRDITICAEFPPEVLPPHERMSGIGMTFADSLPFFWPIPRDPESITELPPPANYCTEKKPAFLEFK